jgi:hypothetical protein
MAVGRGLLRESELVQLTTQAATLGRRALRHGESDSNQAAGLYDGSLARLATMQVASGMEFYNRAGHYTKYA